MLDQILSPQLLVGTVSAFVGLTFVRRTIGNKNGQCNDTPKGDTTKQLSSEMRWTSWSGDRSYAYTAMHSPSTEEELAGLVGHSQSVRVIGTGRSSTPIVAGTATLLDLRTNYNKVVKVDRSTREVTIQSGALLSDLISALEKEGWCLPCLPDIDCVTVGGALATGTHGTLGGRGGQPLHASVTGARVVVASGEVLEFDESSPHLDAVRCAVGVLGMLSTATFRAEPLFTLSVLERPMRDEEWLERLPELRRTHDFLRLLWLPHTGFSYCITGERIAPDTPVEVTPEITYLRHRRTFSDFFYRTAVKVPAFTMLANSILKSLFFSHTVRKKGTLYDATVTKSRGSILELAEWSVPADRFPAAFAEVKDVLNSLSSPAFAHIPMDIRFLRKDTAWLSTAGSSDVVTIGCITRVASNAEHYAAFQAVETVFAKHGGRPHWAKRNNWGSEELKASYPRFEEFCALRKEWDPEGKFLNPYLKGLFAH